MFAAPTTSDIGLRLGLTVVAGLLFGLDRGLKGHAAGLRTMVLVGLAAALAMVEASLLLGTAGKSATSYVSMDVMRLPLGILTGVGFIGGGAILQRGGRIKGMTTAAALWIVTVIGLCFGAGDIGLGLSGTALGVFTVWGLKWADRYLPREQRGEIVIEAEPGLSARAIEGEINGLGCRASLLRQTATADSARRSLHFELRWTRAEVAGAPHDVLEALDRRYRISRFSIPSALDE